MQLNITGNHIELTDALREFTEKKFDRLNAFQDLITSIHITFNVEKLNQIAEAKLHVPGLTVVAKSESEDLYAAIDSLVDKVQRQLVKYREKQTAHRG